MSPVKASISLTCVLLAVTLSVAGCVCGNTGGTPTPAGTPTYGPSITALPAATPSPRPAGIISAELSDWGTDKETYARGENATGWVYVRNTGNVTIDRIDFALIIRHPVPLFGEYTATYSYNMTGLDIRPGRSERVQFVQKIPAEYSGISTAGSYRFDVIAFLDGKTAGNFSKDIRVV